LKNFTAIEVRVKQKLRLSFWRATFYFKKIEYQVLTRKLTSWIFYLA